MEAVLPAGLQAAQRADQHRLFAPQLEEAVMSELTGDPHDRDIALYRREPQPA